MGSTAEGNVKKKKKSSACYFFIVRIQYFPPTFLFYPAEYKVALCVTNASLLCASTADFRMWPNVLHPNCLPLGLSTVAIV